ncbi:MAG TPA: zinc-dependent alcohol dehydrogenase [Tepidisphaeraceae bacterium]|nr:zinc-dependent alcohol dehydrogenase [Tepidisphaeraceae bacterium]
MKAVTWCGKYKVSVDNVPDPRIINPRDAIVRITSTCICGSDLHLYDGYIPTMQRGDILGHEFMGVVEEVGPGFRSDHVKVGDRVVVPFNIACGNCFFCAKQLYSCCDNSNPNAHLGERMYGFSTAGLFGYSHLTGGYAGGQAEYARVPYADMNLQKIPQDLDDDKAVFLTDVFPTGWMAAENCDIQPGDTVACWGCGPVGQFAIRCAFLMGAEKVVAIDDGTRVPERLKMAADAGAITIDMRDEYVYDKLLDITGGRGPDSCIDAVGMEAHGFTVDAFMDKAKAALYMATDRPHALRQAINCCRKGGTVSVPGVYGGLGDKLPVGAFMQKGLTMKTGQTHCQKYIPHLINLITEGKIDPSFVITHKLPLSQAPHGYEIFNAKRDGCIKVVLKPGQ